MDKSGEYYLKNVQMQNKRQDFNVHKRESLNNPQNLENVLGNISKIKKRASKIVTLLPQNSLTPIPKKEGIEKVGMANGYKKKELNDAQRTAVFIRRLEYATSMKRKVVMWDEKDNEKKIILIQDWWRTMFKIIKLQKNMRGFFFRKKLMNNLEHQEKLFQFITEFDNIYNYHLFRQFMDNLKKKRDYEKAKLMEKCEDFAEKLDNLEKLNNLKNLKRCFNKWRKINKKKKKFYLDNFAKKLNNILVLKQNKSKLDTIKKIKTTTKKIEKNNNDKVKKFRAKKAKEKLMKNLKRMHKLNNILKKLNDKNNTKNKKNALDKLKKYNRICKFNEKLNKLFGQKAKKDTFDKLKTMQFIDKLNNLLQKHNDDVNNNAKKILLDKLKNNNNNYKKKNILNRWKNLIKDIDDRRKIINKLIKYKKDELKKQDEDNKKKFTISTGINDFQLVPEKKIEQVNEHEISPQQTVDYIAPEIINFKFGVPQESVPKKQEMKIFKNQLNNLTIYNNNKLLKKYFDKWKELLNKREIKNSLIKFRSKKTAGDKFKKIINNSQKKKDENNLKKYFDKWKENSKKLRQKCLENLANKLNEILTKAKNESDEALKEEAFDTLKKNNDIIKGSEILKNFMERKPKKDVFDVLKKNAGMSEGFRILDKLVNNKENLYKEEFINNLKKINNMKEASDILDKLLLDKMKEKLMNKLNKNAKYQKGLEKLDNIYNLLSKKLKNESFDRLLLNDDIQKASDILDKLINNKLLDDTFKKLVAMDFEHILRNYKNKLDKNKKERENKIRRVINSLKKLRNKEKEQIHNLLKKYFHIWKDKITRRNIKDYFIENSRMQKALNKWKKIKELRQILEGLKNLGLKKKYFNKLKGEVDRKNILRNAKRNKILRNSFKKKEKATLDKYLNQWLKNAKKLQEKEKLTKNLLNIYKKNENTLLKKYFDKWRNAKISKEELKDEVPKYRKKSKFKEATEPYIIIDENKDKDNDKFNPTYYKSKKNIFKEKYIPFRKITKYKKPEKDSEEQFKGFDYLEPQKEEFPKIKKNLMQVKKFNNNDEDSSSNEDTIQSPGEKLITKDKIIGQTVNYTSQSFFIDKELKDNLINSKNYDISTHNKNILPMKMKGDFLSLIQQNPKILKQKNPRIQVTNATCDLNQIINNDNTDTELNTEEINSEVQKLNDNYIIDNNKVLSKVIDNCDKDLYESQKPFYTKKDKYYSVGIPLNNNEAKWEFLNNIKGERGKNNTNKFELIQREKIPIREESKYNKRSLLNKSNISTARNIDTSFKLKEINYMQYYRSPLKDSGKKENEKEIIRYDRLRKIKNRQNTSLFLNKSMEKRKVKNKYNIIRSNGKIELDPKNKTIDNDDFDDSENIDN